MLLTTGMSMAELSSGAVGRNNSRVQRAEKVCCQIYTTERHTLK